MADSATDAASPGSPPAARAGNVVAGVVTTAAGATLAAQLLGIFADIAQVADLTRAQWFFAATIVITALGLFALFSPRQTGYRASTGRVFFTICAVLASGTALAVEVEQRFRPPVVVAQPVPSGPASAPVSVPASVPASSSAPVAPPPPAPPGGGGFAPADDSDPGPVAPARPTTAAVKPPAIKNSVRVAATMGCTPSSCATSEFEMNLGGSLSGTLASGHELMLFVQAPDGRHYPGSKGQSGGGEWFGKVHVGSRNGTESTYSYSACLYDIDETFAADLGSRSYEEQNQGFTRVPTSGSAKSLVCRRLRWDRP